MSPARKNAESNSFNEIATLRIELQDTDPVIWRQVEVPTSVTLKVLHDIVQAVMGWFNYHLWEFTIGKQRYGPSADEDWGTEPRIEAGKVRLRDVLKPGENVIDYLYDFGDCWEHRITITNIRPGEPGASYPRYIAGEWNAPPEDCGGIPGFYGSMNMTPRSSMNCPSNTPSAASRTNVMLPRHASPTRSKPHQPAEQPQSITAAFTGWLHMFKSGERSYCIIGEWADMTDLEAARPKMIATLDTFRDTLEDLGLGVTDPVSGPVVLELK